MRRKFKVGPDGQIGGLSVIGFNGEVDFSQTPARREPIFRDEEGRLVGLEDVERAVVMEGVSSAQAIWGRMGPSVESSLPGIATKLDRPEFACLGHLMVVLGVTELRCAKELAVGASDDRILRLNEFLAWLRNPNAPAAPRLKVQRLGEGVAWYCSAEEAFALYQCISRAAEQLMIRAFNERSERALYQASWWLARAAMEDSDRYIAAVGLERSERRMADAYLKATFRRRPLAEIEDGLVHARGVFDDRCAVSLSKVKNNEIRDAEGHPAAGLPVERGAVLRIGSLAQARSSVRERFVVRRHAA